MSTRACSVLLSVMFGALLIVSQPVRGRADDVPYWPADQERRLAELDKQVVQKMDEISAARVRGEQAKVESLSKEYKNIQDERVKLLRATGQLPR